MVTPNSPDELNAILNQMQSAIQSLRAELDESNRRREALETTLMGSGPVAGRKSLGMTSRKAFNALPHYGGKADEYDSWKFKVTSFLNEGPGYQELLPWIEHPPGEISKVANEKRPAVHLAKVDWPDSQPSANPTQVLQRPKNTVNKTAKC